MPRLVTLLVAFILTACGSAAPPGAVTTVPLATASATRARPASTSQSEVTAVDATPTRTGPPGVTLAYGGATCAGQLSGYTWSFQAGHTTIADGFPDARALEPLAAPSGAALLLTIGAAAVPVRVDVQPYPLAGQQPHVGAPYLPALPVILAGQQALITAALAPGDYLLLVVVRWSSSQADYGFRLALEP